MSGNLKYGGRYPGGNLSYDGTVEGGAGSSEQLNQCPPLSPELRRMIEAELKGALGFVPEQFQEGYYAALRKLLREADSLASPTGKEGK